ncbi:MAG: ribonuclease P protein component [Oscillospiraceae bacterium]|jgi:ribonuclease P protein component|nr:ribonuclease P protein component [Oscillospiraceae bacterium]
MPMIKTLVRNGDFRRAYACGKSLAHPALVTYAAKNRAGKCRYGITASKKIGNAVERNRSRRVISEALRTLNEPTCGNWDLVFVARGKTKHTKSTQIQHIMRGHLRKLGVLQSEPAQKDKP